jgi:hypothetical protein
MDEQHILFISNPFYAYKMLFCDPLGGLLPQWQKEMQHPAFRLHVKTDISPENPLQELEARLSLPLPEQFTGNYDAVQKEHQNLLIGIQEAQMRKSLLLFHRAPPFEHCLHAELDIFKRVQETFPTTSYFLPPIEEDRDQYMNLGVMGETEFNRDLTVGDYAKMYEFITPYCRNANVRLDIIASTISTAASAARHFGEHIERVVNAVEGTVHTSLLTHLSNAGSLEDARKKLGEATGYNLMQREGREPPALIWHNL